jgi:ribulose-5-phosphate 4-epimerase/fuculose-1-phosphate aldolase
MHNNEQKTRQDLAAVYRLIAHYGWDDLIYTHVSARIPDTDTFLINQWGLRFDEVTASNLVKVDYNGNVVGPGEINPTGYVIHGIIHKARPEVSCIIHTHTSAGAAVAADPDGLWPISQKAMICLSRLCYHDYQGIVLDDSESQQLVQELDNNRFMILRNHGLLTVGNTIAETFHSHRLLELACEIQARCQRDRVVFLDTDTIDRVKAQIDKFFTKFEVSWSALMRIVERKYPDYAD